MAVTTKPTPPSFIDLLAQAARGGNPIAPIDVSVPSGQATPRDTTAPAPLVGPPSVDQTTPPIVPGVNDAPTLAPNNLSSVPIDVGSEARIPTLAPDNPSFLQKLGRYASGFFGLSDNTPQAQKGAEIGDLTGRVSRGLALAEGTPEQKEIAEQQTEMPLKIASLQSMANYRTGQLSNAAQRNAVQQERTGAEFGPTSPSAIKAQADAALVQPKAENLQTDTAQKKAMLLSMIPLDSTLAGMIHRPDLAGQQVSPLFMKSVVEPTLSAQGYHMADLGQEGLWTLDRAGNKVHQISVSSPSIARGQAYEQAKAQYTPTLTPTYDENGNAVGYKTISELEALNTGVPTVARPNQEHIMNRTALVTDISGALENVRDFGKKIPSWDPAERTKLAAAITDPSTDSGTFLQSAVAGTLTPDERNYVISAKVAQEAASSLRTVLGSGQGSELQRKLILAVTPSAATPDYDYLNRQIDQLQGVLTRVGVGKGIPSLTPTPTSSATPKANGTSPRVRVYNPKTGKLE